MVMTNKTDYTTKRNYFISVDDDINDLQKKLHSIINRIDNLNTDLDGRPRQVTDTDASIILDKLQKLVDQYRG
tara:strand:+ start:1090 stop:1308 length:219 start_codon:yes stop_codon:yes gene_type:complete